MAKGDGFGTVLKYGALAVGGYLLYEWWKGSVVQVGAPPPVVTTPAPGVPPAAPNPASDLAARLIAAAGLSASSTLNADQWSYYYASTGHAAIDPATFGALFFPSGRPADPSAYPQMTAAQFVAAIATRGLNGFGYRFLAVPPVAGSLPTMPGAVPAWGCWTAANGRRFCA